MSLEDFSHRGQGCQLRGRTDGALKSRTDHLPATDLKETFTHDSLRRLTRASSRHARGTRNLDYRYDALGNLTSNADVNRGGVRIGVCEPGKCPSDVSDGTPPSRIIQ